MQNPEEKRLPPVHLWNPPLSGDIDIVITREGVWRYQGQEIKRQKSVNLFSGILKMEEGEYFLVTPYEKWRISVEVAPFFITDMKIEGEGEQQVILFTTSTGDHFAVDKNHPIQIEQTKNEAVPTATVRGNLTGIISRTVFYRLAEIAVPETKEGREVFGVYSSGVFYPLES
ncbi:MAG: hypothetical protein CSB48_05725 [Proteobacteria bacterium]|nr:MAG: hypothetical protein CSB48_05725 [Pseudomonadota bacterium]